MVPGLANRRISLANVPQRASDATIASVDAPSSAVDRANLGRLNPGDLHFHDVEHDAGKQRLLAALAGSSDRSVQRELQDAIDHWTREALDACFDGKDDAAALKLYHDRMAAFAQAIGLVAPVEAGIKKAVAGRENKLKDSLHHKSFLGRVFGKVTGVIGGVIGVVSRVTDKTMDTVGWALQGILHLAALPFGPRAVTVVDVVGKEIHGFCTGLGDAFKGTFDGMSFMIQHPVVAVKGLATMVIHPSQIMIALQAMWLEARRGGWGHAAGYIFGNLAPILFTGGASEGTLIGKVANSALLKNTLVGRAMITTTTKISNSMEILRRLATFDVGGVVDGISNFGKPLVITPAGASAFATSRNVARMVKETAVHPVLSFRGLAERLSTGLKGFGKRGKLAARTRLVEARTAAGTLRSEGSVAQRMLAAEQVFKKGVKTAEEARKLGQAQAVADKVLAKLATDDLKSAFQALWRRDFAGFTNHIGEGADAVGKIQLLNDAINGIGSVANTVGSVLDPGGKLEGKLNSRLVNATRTGLTSNQVMAMMELLRVNQDGVYEGDEARKRKDRGNGILKVLNPLG